MTPLISPLENSPLTLQPAESNPVATVGSDFSQIIKSSIEQAASAEAAGDKAIESLQSGEAKNLHEVMISVEKADISLRMLVQFRNKALQAYDEMMRIQI